MTYDTRPRTSTSSSRPGSELLQKMQPLLAPPEPVTYALLHGAQRRSMRKLGAGCELLGASCRDRLPSARFVQLPATSPYVIPPTRRGVESPPVRPAARPAPC